MGEQPLVRMGIHTGEVEESSTGLVSYEIHRAARIGVVGHGGQVLLSSTSTALAQDMLAPEVPLRAFGTHWLKDLGHPEAIFDVSGDAGVAEPCCQSHGQRIARDSARSS